MIGFNVIINIPTYNYYLLFNGLHMISFSNIKKKKKLLFNSVRSFHSIFIIFQKPQHISEMIICIFFFAVVCGQTAGRTGRRLQVQHIYVITSALKKDKDILSC